MRIEADGPVFTRLAMVLVAILAVASFSLSFLGMIQAAAWAGIPEYLRWLVPVVVDSTILVYAAAATVQRARGESTRISWIAVGFFTAVSVAANAAHVIAPDGVAQVISPSVAFGAFLAGIMPVSLFFATHTTVQLAVAPVHGSVASRQRRAAKKMVQDHGMDQSKDRSRTAARTTRGPGVDHRMDQGVDHPKDHLGPGRRGPVTTDPAEVLRLNAEGLSQRVVAQQLGISKTTVARILDDPEKALAAWKPVAVAR
ncbi:DUF2637 domain-containing protein [Arthrobacter sp. N1]|uniref:DUF2637 domain-containing protein n=1 Tax=Arthrobacter sp. N1 TaxID=619291 RepID=UPI003BAEC44C